MVVGGASTPICLGPLYPLSSNRLGGKIFTPIVFKKGTAVAKSLLGDVESAEPLKSTKAELVPRIMARLPRNLYISLALCFAIAGVAPESEAQPGDLSDIVVDISSAQYVGNSFVGTARLLLLDTAGNLVSSYDIAANPITLTADRGLLIPGVLDNPAWLSGGIVDLQAAGVSFTGATGTVEIDANVDTIVSEPIIVSFNGYDLGSAFDLRGEEITDVFSGVPTEVGVVVSNDGIRAPSTQPRLRSFFASGGNSLEVFFPGGANGAQDTVTLSLPTSGLAAGLDTLIIELTAEFAGPDGPLTTSTVIRRPIQVQPPVQLVPVAGTFIPDSTYAGQPFGISFDVDASTFDAPIDSVRLRIALADSIGGPSLVTIYDDNPRNSSVNPSVFQYRGLQAAIPLGIVSPGRGYVTRLQYELYSLGSRITLTDEYPFTFFLLSPIALQYQAGSFAPTEVIGGRETAFSFTLFLPGSIPVNVATDSATIFVNDDGFSASTRLLIADSTLEPGSNVVTSEGIFIPANRIGSDLTVTASLVFGQLGSSNRLTFSTDFGGQLVDVIDRPRLQVVSLTTIAPNAPTVNTGQVFLLAAEIRNLSPITAARDFTVRLFSDNGSIFTPDLLVDSLAPLATDTILFNVTASSNPTTSEVFSVDLVRGPIDVETPIDFIESITIQTPADLRLQPLLSGVSGGVIEAGRSFSLSISLENDGDADVAPAPYRLTTGGVDLGIGDSLVGQITPESPLTVTLTAPDDTGSIAIDFTLRSTPIDINSGGPATIGDTAFSLALQVVQQRSPALTVTSSLPTNLISPGQAQRLVTLELRSDIPLNGGDIILESIALTATGTNGALLNPISFVEVSQTELTEDGTRLSIAEADLGRLSFGLTDFRLSPGETRTVDLGTVLASQINDDVILTITADDLTARLINAPPGNDTLQIAAPGGGNVILSQRYVVTGARFAESFAIRNNPFNPTVAPAEFRFIPPGNGTIEFAILTLTGEIVLRRDILLADIASMPGSGDPFVTVTWDGRNEDGQSVLNGVYVVVITDNTTGQQAQRKIALVK